MFCVRTSQKIISLLPLSCYMYIYVCSSPSEDNIRLSFDSFFSSFVDDRTDNTRNKMHTYTVLLIASLFCLAFMIDVNLQQSTEKYIYKTEPSFVYTDYVFFCQIGMESISTICVSWRVIATIVQHTNAPIIRQIWAVPNGVSCYFQML